MSSYWFGKLHAVEEDDAPGLCLIVLDMESGRTFLTALRTQMVSFKKLVGEQVRCTVEKFETCTAIHSVKSLDKTE